MVQLKNRELGFGPYGEILTPTEAPIILVESEAPETKSEFEDTFAEEVTEEPDFSFLEETEQEVTEAPEAPEAPEEEVETPEEEAEEEAEAPEEEVKEEPETTIVEAGVNEAPEIDNDIDIDIDEFHDEVDEKVITTTSKPFLTTAKSKTSQPKLPKATSRPRPVEQEIEQQRNVVEDDDAPPERYEEDPEVFDEEDNQVFDEEDNPQKNVEEEVQMQQVATERRKEGEILKPTFPSVNPRPKSLIDFENEDFEEKEEKEEDDEDNDVGSSVEENDFEKASISKFKRGNGGSNRSFFRRSGVASVSTGNQNPKAATEVNLLQNRFKSNASSKNIYQNVHFLQENLKNKEKKEKKEKLEKSEKLEKLENMKKNKENKEKKEKLVVSASKAVEKTKVISKNKIPLKTTTNKASIKTTKKAKKLVKLQANFTSGENLKTGASKRYKFKKKRKSKTKIKKFEFGPFRFYKYKHEEKVKKKVKRKKQGHHHHHHHLHHPEHFAYHVPDYVIHQDDEVPFDFYDHQELYGLHEDDHHHHHDDYDPTHYGYHLPHQKKYKSKRKVKRKYKSFSFSLAATDNKKVKSKQLEISKKLKSKKEQKRLFKEKKKAKIPKIKVKNTENRKLKSKKAAMSQFEAERLARLQKMRMESLKNLKRSMENGNSQISDILAKLEKMETTTQMTNLGSYQLINTKPNQSINNQFSLNQGINNQFRQNQSNYNQFRSNQGFNRTSNPVNNFKHPALVQPNSSQLNVNNNNIKSQQWNDNTQQHSTSFNTQFNQTKKSQVEVNEKRNGFQKRSDYSPNTAQPYNSNSAKNYREIRYEVADENDYKNVWRENRKNRYSNRYSKRYSNNKRYKQKYKKAKIEQLTEINWDFTDPKAKKLAERGKMVPSRALGDINNVRVNLNSGYIELGQRFPKRKARLQWNG